MSTTTIEKKTATQTPAKAKSIRKKAVAAPYGKLDMTSFFIRLQEQNDAIADWSESTVKKLKSVLNRILRENDYLDSIKAGHLNPVWLYPELENVILTNGDQAVLPAFNRFE